MKKYFALLITILFVTFPYATTLVAHAQTCPDGSTPAYSFDLNSGNSTYTCPTTAKSPGSVTTVAGQATGNGQTPVTTTNPATTPAPAATPTVSPTSCPNGGTYDASKGVCNLGYTPLEPIPGLTPVNGVWDLTSPTGFASFINALFTILISCGALLAVVMLTIGGVQYMTASSIGNKTQGIERAQAALWGLLLIAGIWLILNTINPHLLNFNFIACDPNNPACSATAKINNATTATAPTPAADQTLSPAQTTAVLSSVAQTPDNCAEMQQLVNSHDNSIVQFFYDYAKSVKYGVTNVQSTIDAERQFVNSCNNINSGAAGL